MADWSSLKDDNGYYPGVRVAVAFAQETGIMTGANRPDDITVGDLALILPTPTGSLPRPKGEKYGDPGKGGLPVHLFLFCGLIE